MRSNLEILHFVSRTTSHIAEPQNVAYQCLLLFEFSLNPRPLEPCHFNRSGRG